MLSTFQDYKTNPKKDFDQWTPNILCTRAYLNGFKSYMVSYQQVYKSKFEQTNLYVNN